MPLPGFRIQALIIAVDSQERRHRNDSALRGLACFLAALCAFTTLGSLVVALFVQPEAWFMVVF